MSATVARCQFHLARARQLVDALRERAALETLSPIRPATTLATSLRVLTQEIDLALAELEAAERRGARRYGTCTLCGGLGGAHVASCQDSPVRREVRT
jgi:hypothetical protein